MQKDAHKELLGISNEMNNNTSKYDNHNSKHEKTLVNDVMFSKENKIIHPFQFMEDVLNTCHTCQLAERHTNNDNLPSTGTNCTFTMIDPNREHITNDEFN